MIIKDLIEKYNEKYGISYIDLADAGESNRIIVHIASACLFGFALFCIGLYSIKFYSELSKHINSFIYYIVMLITSFYAFFASKQKKEQEQQPKDQMSKENAEQLLNAAIQEEKATQQRMKKAMQQPRSRKLQKNW